MMAGIPVRNFATLVGNFATGVQGRAKQLVDFSQGSVLRAVAEATADILLWFQSIVVYLLTLTRASTSKGKDLDSWFADWFFERLPSKATTGPVTFSRFSTTGRAVVPVGAQVSTGDLSLLFSVYKDSSNPAWSDLSAGYLLIEGQSSVSVPVEAVMLDGTTQASAWNVAAGQISLIRSETPGVDTVLNMVPFTTGLDQESDESFQAGFPGYIASFSKATPSAIKSAVERIQVGTVCTVVSTPGLVVVTVDDGSGSPSDGLISKALDVVSQIRAGGVRYAVVGAQKLNVSVVMTVEVDEAYFAPDVVARVVAALGVFINSRGLSKPLRYTSLSSEAYKIPGVLNVSGVTVNGSNKDLVPTQGQTVKAFSLVVSPGV